MRMLNSNAAACAALDSRSLTHQIHTDGVYTFSAHTNGNPLMPLTHTHIYFHSPLYVCIYYTLSLRFAVYSTMATRNWPRAQPLNVVYTTQRSVICIQALRARDSVCPTLGDPPEQTSIITPPHMLSCLVQAALINVFTHRVYMYAKNFFYEFRDSPFMRFSITTLVLNYYGLHKEISGYFEHTHSIYM